MIRARPAFEIFCFLLFVVIALHADSIFAQCGPAQKFDTHRLYWKSLTFKAQGFFGTVKNDVQLNVWPATGSGSEKFLVPSPKGQVLNAVGSDLLFISVLSAVTPIVGLPERFSSQAWYAPNPATVLQRIRMRQGKEKWQKTYRFANNGVYRLRKKPNSTDESKMSLERWSNSERSFYPYGVVGNDGCSHVLEPSILLYIASTIDAGGEEAPLSLCVFNKKQLHQVQIRMKGSERLKINYTEKSRKNEFTRKGEIETNKYSFETRSLAGPHQEAEPFSFMGLKGDFDIYVDKTSQIPVQVRGRISGVGEVTFKLHKTEVRQ